MELWPLGTYRRKDEFSLNKALGRAAFYSNLEKPAAFSEVIDS